MNVKVRHALVNYTVPGKDNRGNDRELDEIALRGQIVDIPRDQVDRLKTLGAVVAPDVDLERPGVMMALPESPTDEEILAWVRSARREEVVALAQGRPELVDRLSGAMDRVERDYARQMELLGHAVPDRRPVAGEPAPAPTVPPVPPTPPNPNDPAALGNPDGHVYDGPAAAEVVKGSVEQVAEHLAEYPDQAQAILDAENVHTKGKARNGVLAAVQAAIGHSA